MPLCTTRDSQLSVALTVAKLTSIRIVLALAAKYDYELVTYDVKTAFLHALLDRIIFCKHIPGFPIPAMDDGAPADALQVIHAIYGLRQSSHEFYVLLRGVLESIGLLRCEVDHAIFYGHFSKPPDPSILMPPGGVDLVIFMPVHVDDGLVATNSIPLYHWILTEMNKRIEVVDQGAASLYLGIRITHDRSKHKLWLSQCPFVVDLLTSHNLMNAHSSLVPLCHTLHDLPPVPPGALPDISDNNVKVHFQRLVGSLLYLAICTRPDISYTTMALGR